ncbi:MAG: hypothetical protein AB1806_05520 [Acidobacteriota bacterium]
MIRWIDPPVPSSFLADLRPLGEALLLLPPHPDRVDTPSAITKRAIAAA